MNQHRSAGTSGTLSLDWQAQGVCREEDPELFFSPDGERGEARARREALARAVCRRCPVLSRCQEQVLLTGEEYGTWGAFTEGDRANLHRRRPKVASTGQAA